MKSLKFLAVSAVFLCLILAAGNSYAQSACVANTNYTTTTQPGVAIVPGTVDVGNHCDDCVTAGLATPFPVRIYNQGPFTTYNVSSNGNLQFVSINASLGNVCLPTATMDSAIFGHWDDLRTDQISPSCTIFPTGCGVFTSTSGVAPNRIFNIEWRTGYFGVAGTTNWEIRLHEANALFEIVYGTITNGGVSATSGVQRDTGSFFTQFSCNTAIPNATQVTYTCPLVPVELMGVSVE